jgi:hypothetical protein
MNGNDYKTPVLKPLSPQELAAAPYMVKFIAKAETKYPNITRECAVKYPEYFDFLITFAK